MGLSKFKIKYREFVDILRHEYHYIFHDGGVLLVVVGAILIYSTAYSFAYKNEVLRDIPIAIVDNSQTPSSRQIIRSFDATPNLRVAYKPTSLEEAKKLFYQRKVNGVIVIPSDYEKKLQRAEKVNLAIYADASYFLMYRQVFFDVTNSVLHSNGNVVRFERRPAETGRGAEQSGDDLRKEPVQSVRRLCDFHHAGHHHGHHPADAADRDRHGRRNVARAETVPDADTRRRKTAGRAADGFR